MQSILLTTLNTSSAMAVLDLVAEINKEFMNSIAKSTKSQPIKSVDLEFCDVLTEEIAGLQIFVEYESKDQAFNVIHGYCSVLQRKEIHLAVKGRQFAGFTHALELHQGAIK